MIVINVFVITAKDVVIVVTNAVKISVIYWKLAVNVSVAMSVDSVINVVKDVAIVMIDVVIISETFLILVVLVIVVMSVKDVINVALNIVVQN